MNTTLKLAILTALVLAGPLLSQKSAALDAAAQPSDNNELVTIIVTAEKRAEPLANVPMSVTALPGDTLDKLVDRDFSDYASMVPGLSLFSTQPGITRLTLRGQNSGGDGSTVAVYLDESPFGSSNALLNGAVLTGDFDTWDLQRIEVLRGPQGTLYGANSEGGLLKFVTTAPVLGSFSGAVETTGESVDHGGNGGDIRAVVNLPLGDKFALRVGGFYQDVPGWIDDPLSGQKDVNEGHKNGGRASLLAAPIDDLTIRLTAETQESRYEGTPLVDVNPVTLQPVNGDLTQERFMSEPSSFRYDNYNATIDWNAGPFSILSTTSYGILDSDYINDATSTVLVPPSLTVGEFLGLVIGPGLGAYIDNHTGLSKFTQEIRLTSSASDRLEWQVGGYFTHEIGSLVEHLNAVTLPGAGPSGLPSLEVPVLDSTYKEYAGFANLTYHFNSQFDVQAGGRFSKNEQDFTETVTGLLVTPTAITTDSSGHVLNYSLAPQWHVDANTMVYARVASGYRPGGPNALPAIAPPSVPREYGSDKTVNVELGVRSSLLDKKLTVDVAAFHVNWTNIQLIENVNGYNINGNGGTAKSQGLEWTVGYIPLRGLTFSLTGAYTDAYLTADAPAVGGVSGDPLPYAPKWSGALDGEYDWAAFANYKAFVGATWAGVGSRRADFNSQPPPNVVPPPGTTEVVLPQYNSVDARIGLDNSKYRIMLYGKNLGDSRGITSYANEGAPGLNGEVAYIQPRTIGVTLSAKF
jgi:outer membrane receptor protein involved in Fe transport